MIILNLLDTNEQIEIESEKDITFYVTSNIKKITKPNLTIFVSSSSEDYLELQSLKINPFLILNKSKFQKYINDLNNFKNFLEKLLMEKNVEKEKILVSEKFKPQTINEVIVINKPEEVNKNFLKDTSLYLPPIYALYENSKKIVENFNLSILYSTNISETAPQTTEVQIKRVIKKENVIVEEPKSTFPVDLETKIEKKKEETKVEPEKIIKKETEVEPEKIIEKETKKEIEKEIEEEYLPLFEYNLFIETTQPIYSIYDVLKQIYLNKELVEEVKIDIEKKLTISKKIYFDIKEKENEMKKIILYKKLSSFILVFSEILYQLNKKQNAIIDKNKIFIKYFNIFDNIYLMKSTYYTTDEEKLNKDKFEYFLYIIPDSSKTEDDNIILLNEKTISINDIEMPFKDGENVIHNLFIYLYNDNILEIVNNIINIMI